MNPRRVMVTGIGVVSALGIGADAFWEGVRGGQSGIRPLTLVARDDLRIRKGAEVPGYRPEAHFEKKELAMMDRFAQFGLLAAREALAEAALPRSPVLRARTAVVTGSSMGGQTVQDEGFEALYAHGHTRVHPLSIPRVMPNAAASLIAMTFGLSGPAYTVSSACSSASHAIGQAFWMVRSGLVDAAVAGGSEAPFSYGHLKAWEALRVVASDTCRPFSRDRNGMILGEGGGMLVLEPLESVRERNAAVYGEIVGFGMSADAHHLTQPSVDGAARAVRAALADAGIAPEDVGYVNAHGTGTLANDPAETQVIRRVFGAHADRLPVSSTKAAHGHALGAAGALEAAATLLALRHGLLPPTVHFTTPDPACDLDVIPNEARPASVRYAVSQSFAFGGLNAVLVFGNAGRWTTDDGR